MSILRCRFGKVWYNFFFIICVINTKTCNKIINIGLSRRLWLVLSDEVQYLRELHMRFLHAKFSHGKGMISDSDSFALQENSICSTARIQWRPANIEITVIGSIRVLF